MKPIIILPARLASTRLPNKPLALIGGEPMIVQVWKRAVAAGVGDVVVASEFLQHDLDASPLFPRYEVPLYGVSSFATDGVLSEALLQEAAETGLYHTGARYYDPRLGRFLSTDPLMQAPGLNVYAYVVGDPLNAVDPDEIGRAHV